MNFPPNFKIKETKYFWSRNVSEINKSVSVMEKDGLVVIIHPLQNNSSYEGVMYGGVYEESTL